MAVLLLQSGLILGGVGTTAAALKAKISMIIVSIIADQPLTTQKLLAAIEKTDTFEIKFHVNKMGEQISQDAG